MMSRANALFHRESGLTLIELMVAIVLGLVLLAGIVTIFVSNKQTYKYQSTLSELQENGRFASNLLTREIRRAGNFGCAARGGRQENTLNNASSFFYAFDKPVFGYEGGDKGAIGGTRVLVVKLDDGTTKTLSAAEEKEIFGDSGPFPLPGTDVISVRNADDANCFVEKHNPTSAVIHCKPPGASVEAGDIVMVTNCSDSVVTQVTGPAVVGPKDVVVHNTGVIGGMAPGNAFHKTRTNYTGNGRILKLSIKTFFVADTGRDKPDGRPVLALYRVGANRIPEEYVEGIEDLQIVYGVDGDGDPGFSAETYTEADAVDKWNDVRMVRYALLVQSQGSNVLPDYQEITFSPDTGAAPQYPMVSRALGDLKSANDHHWRQVYASAVAVRNRVP